MTPATSHPEVGIASLIEGGFTAEQIARLLELRATYPALEFLSTSELRRLEFVKWRHQHADIEAE
jgi:hypothetical protein